MYSGSYVRTLRKIRGLLVRELASFLDIDSAILSKIERGERLATKNQIQAISTFFNLENKELIVLWLSDKLLIELNDYRDVAIDVLKLSKSKIETDNSSSNAEKK